MQLFKSTVETVLLYSCDALAITETMARHLDASHHALMRYCLGVHFPVPVQLSSVDLYTCVAPATTILLKKSPSLNWSRAAENRCDSDCLLEPTKPTIRTLPTGRRPAPHLPFTDHRRL